MPLLVAACVLIPIVLVVVVVVVLYKKKKGTVTKYLFYQIIDKTVNEMYSSGSVRWGIRATL